MFVYRQYTWLCMLPTFTVECYKAERWVSGIFFLQTTLYDVRCSSYFVIFMHVNFHVTLSFFFGSTGPPSLFPCVPLDLPPWTCPLSPTLKQNNNQNSLPKHATWDYWRRNVHSKTSRCSVQTIKTSFKKTHNLNTQSACRPADCSYRDYIQWESPWCLTARANVNK